MQLTITPDNPLEWLALRANIVPWPLLHAQVMPVIAKAVLEAADRGVFDALANVPLTANELAQARNLNPKATRELLNLLTALGYLTYQQDRFALSVSARKWMVSDAPDSVQGMMPFNNRLMWDWLGQLGHYLETGEGVHYHSQLTPDQWQLYQNGMKAATATEAREFGRRAPVPKHVRAGAPAKMLDIGGSHGQHSVALCKRFARLDAMILDLPEAIEQAAPLLAAQDMGSRVRHQSGNALTDELLENEYDIVLLSSLAHHFTDAQNHALAQRVARSLKPGGVYIVNEFIRPDVGAKPELVGASTDLFYGLTSTAGNYSVAEIQDWQQSSGLKLGKTVWYRVIPGRAMVVGVR
jgi:SAM-dependent methyltransferase